MAVLGLRALPALSLSGGVDLARLDLSIDWRVLGAAIATTLLTLTVAAWLPVRRFTRAGLAGELLAGSAATPSSSSQRVRQALLSLHVTATIVVLVAAGLFVRAVNYGFGIGAGFDIDRLAFATVMLNATVTPGVDVTPEEWQRVTIERTSRLSNAIRAVPGVEAVSLGGPPISSTAASFLSDATSVTTSDEQHEVLLGRMRAGADWLSTMDVPLLSGRGLTAADVTTRPNPAIVTASLARKLWPARDPLGETFSGGRDRRGGLYQVVGVSGDFIYGSFSRPATGTVVIAEDFEGNLPQFVVRTKSPAALAQSLQKIVAALEPKTLWLQIETGREIVTKDLGRQQLGAWFFSGFGLTALLLGVGGVFGLVAYLAESRRREFGVRVALGATPGDVVWRGARAALVPVGAGVVLGLVVAAIVARLFTSLLTGLSALDPLTFVSVGLVMLGCAALASFGAAWRLRGVAPMDALRAE